MKYLIYVIFAGLGGIVGFVLGIILRNRTVVGLRNEVEALQKQVDSLQTQLSAIVPTSIIPPPEPPIALILGIVLGLVGIATLVYSLKNWPDWPRRVWSFCQDFGA
jgi:predicted PurR-regulated permease PerM